MRRRLTSYILFYKSCIFYSRGRQLGFQTYSLTSFAYLVVSEPFPDIPIHDGKTNFRSPLRLEPIFAHEQ